MLSDICFIISSASHNISLQSFITSIQVTWWTSKAVLHRESQLYSSPRLRIQLWNHIHALLLLLSHVSRVRLCVTPQTAAHQAPVPGILQATILQWVAIFFSSAWKWKVKVKSLSRIRLFATPWTVAYQAPPSMGFPRQEGWSGVPLPSPHIHTQVYKIHIFGTSRVIQWLRVHALSAGGTQVWLLEKP